MIKTNNSETLITVNRVTMKNDTVKVNPQWIFPQGMVPKIKSVQINGYIERQEGGKS